MSSATPPPASPTAEKSQAQFALILGILGILCCGPLSVIAWVLANTERKAIREGRRPQDGDTLATIALILGIIGTIFFALGMVWVFFMGGLAILGAAFGRH